MKRILLSLSVILVAIAASAAPEIHYVDALDLTVVNRAQARDNGYVRLNAANYPELPAQVAEYSRHSTGLAVAFRTDSRSVKARWHTEAPITGQNRTPIAYSGLDMYIMRDGEWTFAGAVRPSMTKLDHSGAIVDNMDGTMHDCLIYLPLWVPVGSLEIGVDEGSVIEPLPNPFGHRVVVLGSSITHGASASRPGLTYTARMQRATGWEMPNLGYSGLCKLEPFYARIIADTEADAFVFDGFSNPSSEEIESRLQEFVDIIRAAHPNTPLVFLQTEVRETGNFDMKKRAFEDRKREAARASMAKLFDAGYRDIYFIDPGMPLSPDHDDTVDGVHPTDAGFEKIVNHVLPQLRTIFAPYGIR